MLIENQNNTVDLESNSTKKLKISHENQTEIYVFIELMKLNILIGMKHFIQIIMLTNLAIHTILVPLQTAVLHLRKFLTKYHRVIYKRQKIEKFQRKGKKMKGKDKNTVIKKKKEKSKCNIETIKERKGNVDIYKDMYYHQPKAPVKRIQLIFSSALTRKPKKIFLFSNSIFKNL